MNPPVDVKVGERFGRLTVTGGFIKKPKSTRLWPVQCDCGSPPMFVNVSKLKMRRETDTGCFYCQKSRLIHDVSKKSGVGYKTYLSYMAMKQRCLNPKNEEFYNYGGRGITICDRWLESFANFIEDMGYRPVGPERKTLDRIDSNGNYEPANCRWATDIEQGQNKRDCKAITVRGVDYPSTAEAIRAYSVKAATYYGRIKRGLTIEQALGVK